MWCYGTPVPETFSWRLVRNPHGGAIATMGNTGLGYGMPGIDLTTGGGDWWITIEFFKQYGTEGLDVLGQAYQQTLTNYVNTFDMTDLACGSSKVCSAMGTAWRPVIENRWVRIKPPFFFIFLFILLLVSYSVVSVSQLQLFFSFLFLLFSQLLPIHRYIFR